MILEDETEVYEMLFVEEGKVSVAFILSMVLVLNFKEKKSTLGHLLVAL
jgi:hypothetical protein